MLDNDVQIASGIGSNSHYARLSEPSHVSNADEYYALATEDHFWVRWRFNAIKRAMMTIDMHSVRDVLDVGCGHGVFISQFSGVYPHIAIAGCDLNPAALDMAHSAGIAVFSYDITSEQQELHRRYDLIFLLDVLEHIDDDTQFLRSLAKHVRPGGNIVISVPAMSWLFGPYDAASGHFRRYDRSGLVNVAERSGLTLLSTFFWGGCLVPIAAMRNLFMTSGDSQENYIRGFRQPSSIVNNMLAGIGRMEGHAYPYLPFGTSLIAVVKVS